MNHRHRIQGVCLVACLALYALLSLYSFASTQPTLYQATRPRHNPLDDLDYCVDLPSPDTSLCRHCTRLPSSTHSHCIECNATLPIDCDPRSEGEYNRSRHDHTIRRTLFKHAFLNTYARNHGWLLRILGRSDSPGEQNPSFIADRVMSWALDRAPLQVDPTALGAGVGCVLVLVVTACALLYLHYREQMRTRADWVARSDASLRGARNALLGTQEEILEEDARKRAAAREGDLFKLDKTE